MIKKLIALSLTLLYTVTVLGFAINFHYCLNQVSSVKINEPVKKCSSLRVVKAMKCCKDKKIEVKVKDGHEVSALSFLAKNCAVDLPRTSLINFLPAFSVQPTNVAFDRGPPYGLSSQPPIYLANQSFRI